MITVWFVLLCAGRLLRLLRSTLLALHVLVDVGLVVCLLRDALHGLPALTHRRRHVLPLGNGVAPGADLVQHALYERALADTRAQEDSVDDDQDPAAFLESNSRKKQTEPERDLKASDKRHGGIVVVLDEAANSIRESGALRLLACGRWWRGLDGREEDATGVGRYVEDAVDSEGQQGKGDLLGEEPHKGHGYSRVSPIAHPHIRRSVCSPRYCTFSSAANCSGEPCAFPLF